MMELSANPGRSFFLRTVYTDRYTDRKESTYWLIALYQRQTCCCLTSVHVSMTESFTSVTAYHVDNERVARN